MKKQVPNPTQTILVIVVGLNIMSIIINYDIIIFVSSTIGFFALASSKISKIIDSFWTKIIKLSSYIVPNILLSIIFFFLLFPMSILFKIKTKNPLQVKRKKESMWTSNNREIDENYFKKIW